ncbi:MAG: quinolinate synthase NadA [Firmicutes bacterium]|nr:quinolinate synthase NadA [Bacillota bacterium]
MSTEGLSRDELVREIQRLKEERGAIILAHVYQKPEVQDIADYVGDSLGLSQEAAKTGARVVVFCGVHFMAETAAMLSPEKIVLLPAANAGCPMADMAAAEEVRRKKEETGAVVVAYVNTSAAVKAESDYCCTSANAARVLAAIPSGKPILFVPDRHLGEFAARRAEREVILWNGFCPTHHRLTAEDVLAARDEHPGAPVLVHPECRSEVVELADYVGSTSGIINFVQRSQAREFIIGTESGILHPLRKENPEKAFYLASDKLVCPNMKRTTLELVKRSLETLTPRITVPEEIRRRAQAALGRMLEIGRG